jgi:hypothetical protein
VPSRLAIPAAAFAFRVGLVCSPSCSSRGARPAGAGGGPSHGCPTSSCDCRPSAQVRAGGACLGCRLAAHIAQIPTVLARGWSRPRQMHRAPTLGLAGPARFNSPTPRPAPSEGPGRPARQPPTQVAQAPRRRRAPLGAAPLPAAANLRRPPAVLLQEAGQGSVLTASGGAAV